MDCYIDRPNALFSGVKDSALDNFCYADISAYYNTFSNNKQDHSSEYQSYKFQDKLIKGNHEKCGYPKEIKLTKTQIKIRSRKVKRILQYHSPNKVLYVEKYIHHLLCLSCPFSHEKELLSRCPHLYQNK